MTGKFFKISESSNYSVRIGRVRLNGGQCYSLEAMSKMLTEDQIKNMNPIWVEMPKEGEIRKIKEPIVVIPPILPPKEEKKEEKVKSLSEMSKDELETYAKKKYGEDLDKRKSIQTMIKEIESLGG